MPIDSLSTQQRLTTFILQQFQEHCPGNNIKKLAGDASARQYFRYVDRSDASYILVAYPDSFDLKIFTYKQIYNLLLKIELPVPKLICMDGNLGIVLQEDLGNQSVLRVLPAATKDERQLILSKAIDHIVTLQKTGPKALKPEYEASRSILDEKKLRWELDFFYRHFLGCYRQIKVSREDLLNKELSKLTFQLSRYSPLLCHRDYHVRNLMSKNDQIYILDFQDTRWGPPLYDLVSLLKDSIELETGEILEYQNYYLNHSTWKSNLPTPITQDFDRQFHLTCIQRLLKALGTYGYQINTRGNPVYKQYIPKTMQRVFSSLKTLQEFPLIQSIVERELNL